MKKCKVSLAAIFVIWAFFTIEWIMTWITESSSLYGITRISPSVLIRLGANVPLLVKIGQVYRLFAATILHIGLFQISLSTAVLIGYCVFI
jgi:hypothetical protein